MEIKNRKGFTLIELMIVVGIIAFLGILVTTYLRSQVFKGNDARRKAEIKRIGVAVEEYEKDNNCYPLSSEVNCTNSDGLEPYLDKIPCDPVTQASYFYEHEDSVCPKWYRLYSKLDNDKDVDYRAGIGPNSAFSYVAESSNAPALISSGNGTSSFYGCVSGVCSPIGWNAARPCPNCDPNFQNSTCYGQCGNPSLECQTWNP